LGFYLSRSLDCLSGIGPFACCSLPRFLKLPTETPPFLKFPAYIHACTAKYTRHCEFLDIMALRRLISSSSASMRPTLAAAVTVRSAPAMRMSGKSSFDDKEHAMEDMYIRVRGERGNSRWRRGLEIGRSLKGKYKIGRRREGREKGPRSLRIFP